MLPSNLRSSMVPLGLVREAVPGGGAPPASRSLDFTPSAVPLGLVRERAGPVGGAPPAGRSLNFKVPHQLQTNWCWAAVTAGVAAYYNQPNWTQCRVVCLSLGQAYCCSLGAGSSVSCNQPWYLDRALQRVGNFSDLTSAPLQLWQVVSELNSNRPVGVRIGWFGGGGHFLAIGGYSPNSIDIWDPWWGNPNQATNVSYASFPATYQNRGRWTHSYRTAP
jgi:hypothetical protein